MNKKVPFFICAVLVVFCAGCAGVKRDLVVPGDFQPSRYRTLAVVNMDPQLQYAEYVEAALMKKGYLVKENALAQQVMKKEGMTREDALEPKALSRLAEALQVQGIVFCRVLEFSRFRDAYRLSMKMIDPSGGHTVWSAQGYLEGKKGQKPGQLLQDIVAAALKDLPPVQR